MWKWVWRQRRVSLIKKVGLEWKKPNPNPNPNPNGVIRRSYYTTTSASKPNHPTAVVQQQQKQAWLFVGLGNPGDKFRGTRHNVGFEMVDALADSLGTTFTPHCKALFAQGFIGGGGGSPVFLAKPQTYINLSGQSTAPLAAYYKLPLNRVIVFHDDMQLPCGVLRLELGGGHGSHNGLKSVIEHFRGNRDFARLRIGIGRPPGQMDPKAFLLQKFNSLARQRIDAALIEGVNVLKLIPSQGLENCASWFNKEQKYKHIKPQCIFGLED